jgi:GTP-binding protein HflX
VLVTDTVGFVRKLPHQLVQAFRSTLDEVAEADLLIHVVDASAPDPPAHMEAVRRVLRDIGADDVPELLAFNKADQADPDSARRILQGHPGSVLLSAATGEGVDRLLAAVGDRLRAMTHVVELVVPYDRGDVVAAVHRQGEVVSECHDPEGTRMWARIRPEDLGRFNEFVA